MECTVSCEENDFYPRPPRGGRHLTGYSAILITYISIHALREEGDALATQLASCCCEFLSTPSARRATKCGFCQVRKTEFLSTPSARRATTRYVPGAPAGAISIHALREEGDLVRHYRMKPSLIFLSTPSARRATQTRRRWWAGRCNFYPRPPRGGRPFAEFEVLPDGQFLSTPSARRATLCGLSTPSIPQTFLSTPSARRATGRRQNLGTHTANFYPRPPRGGRPQYPVFHSHFCVISIHALREEGDQTPYDQLGRHPISIHALREEGDG